MPRRTALVTAIRRRAAADAAGLADVDAVVHFADGVSNVSVRIAHGAVAVLPETTPATTTITADPMTLLDVIEGRASGVEAFLDGRLTGPRRPVAGAAARRPVRRRRRPAGPAARARARSTPWACARSYLEAGPPDAPPVLLLHGLGATNASHCSRCSPTSPPTTGSSRPTCPASAPAPRRAARTRPPGSPRWVEAFQRATGSRARACSRQQPRRPDRAGGRARPARSVRALVLLTPSPAFRRLRQYVPVVRLARPELAALPLPLTPRGWPSRASAAMFSDPAPAARRSRYDAAADEIVRVLADRAHRVAFFSCAAADLPRGRVRPATASGSGCPALLPPALFLWGDRDRLVPSSFARHVADALPSAGQWCSRTAGTCRSSSTRSGRTRRCGRSSRRCWNANVAA